MIDNLFEVATEFRFDVGQALVSSDALQGSVEKLSSTADSALTSLQYLAGGLIAHLGFGSGGLLSVLGKAVSISENLDFTMGNFSNNMSSNMRVLQGDIKTFNDRLEVSRNIMGDIARVAVASGLSTTELASLTTQLASPLAARGKLGTNYGGAINMARNLMLTSEAVGLNPQIAGESLTRALNANMPLHGQLFERLLQTPAFRGAGIRTQQQFSGYNVDKKLTLLTKALETVGNDSEWLAHRIQNVNTQITIMRDQIDRVLGPIGNAIKKPLVMMFAQVNTWLAQNGERIGNAIGEFIGDLFKNPEKLFVDLNQLSKLGSDFKSAAFIGGILSLMEHFGLLTLRFNGFIRKMITFLWDGAVAVFTFVREIGIFGWIFKALRLATVEFLPVFASLLYFFQILSRARAVAKVNDVKNVVTRTPEFLDSMVRFKNAIGSIIYPIQQSIEYWAELIAPLFETTFWITKMLPLFDGLIFVLSKLGLVIEMISASIAGMAYATAGFIDDTSKGNNPFKNLSENYKEGYAGYMKEALAVKPGEKVSKATVTNNNHIEARFDMREQLEPDRIAFAVTTHLKKLAISAVGGRGSALDAAQMHAISTGNL